MREYSLAQYRLSLSQDHEDQDNAKTQIVLIQGYPVGQTVNKRRAHSINKGYHQVPGDKDRFLDAQSLHDELDHVFTWLGSRTNQSCYTHDKYLEGDGNEAADGVVRDSHVRWGVHRSVHHTELILTPIL